MSEPNGYLIHGTAFSSKEAAFKALVSNHEQESWFQKIWREDAQPYYFEPQPQLTISKSIADALDVGDLMVLAWTHGNDLLGKVSDEERKAECRRRNNIAKAYLAGKALGVDLVKVVEG